MELSREVQIIFSNSVHFVEERKLEFMTPEIILLKMLENPKLVEILGYAKITPIEKELEEYIFENIDVITDNGHDMTIGAKQLFTIAAESAANSSSQEIYVRHLVHGLYSLRESFAVYVLEKREIAEIDILSALADIDDSENEEASFETDDETDTNEDTSSVSSYAPCLNDTLKDVNPLIGREAELERTIRILCRKDKNNPLHIGEPGVGKTAITHGLVMLIKKGEVPEPLKNAKIYSLDLGSILAGTQYRGDFEKRLKNVLSHIAKEESPIVYIDEIHNISGAGAVGESSFDASNLLKPYLSDGHIRFIGATTFDEYKKHFEKNKSLVRRFQNVEIKEPTEEETVKILNGLKSRYEKFHGIRFSKGVIEYAVYMSKKYINERFLPDKAIDLLDEAGAYRRLNPTDKKVQTVDKDVINTVLTSVCRVPVETVKTDDVSGLKDLEKNLKNMIFGQDEAIEQVVNAVKFSKAGLLDENKPLASILFVGPTGVGKTEIARKLSDELGVKLVRFDMSEYGEKHAVAKLIGSPAGYVGYEDGGQLTEAIRKNPSSVLLLDEIEKAHPDIYNILLQIMDYATLTDNQGRKADFRNVIVIMTSNAGASMIGKSGIGFVNTDNSKTAVMDAVKKTFQPEFRNRLNKIVVFSSMNDDMALKIVNKKLSETAEQLSKKNILLTVENSATELIKKKGISKEFGAREVDRIIRNEIKPLFVDEMLFGKLKKGGMICLSADNDRFIVKTAKRS